MVSACAGGFVKQPTGYEAFVPKPLPPDPPLQYDIEMINRLAMATEKLGRLDGVTRTLPNPDLFVSMFVRKEAVLSSQIEGTQASLDDIIAYESKGSTKRMPGDVAETVNYVYAMNYGLNRVREIPLSLRLIREIHERLLRDTRGAEKGPGDFRKTQNWIGPPGCSLKEAVFVPPPPLEMVNSLFELEKFLHEEHSIPPLVSAALVHAQFETIHPFLDGNGRIGRLLITFMLCHYGSLNRPLLYLSYFFKSNRKEYYDLLNRTRTNGEWESWVKFFLSGVIEVSDKAIDTVMTILKLRLNHIDILRTASKRGTTNYLRFLDMLFETPAVTASRVSQRLGVSRQTAYALIRKFEKLNILDENVQSSWGRIFFYGPYLNILREGTQL